MGDALGALPLFRIFAVVPSAQGGAILHGRLERGYLYTDMGSFWLWTSETETIMPTIMSLDEATGAVEAMVGPDELSDVMQPGAVLHWAIPAKQAYHVPMILEGRWTRRDFEAQDAIHFRQDDVHGWTRYDGKIPDGAVQTHLEKGGWDHEHCEICWATIGAEGSAYGYVDDDEHWLCPECYEKWAVPRSLGFMT